METPTDQIRIHSAKVGGLVAHVINLGCWCTCTDRPTVMMILAVMDPEGSRMRKAHRLSRRTYVNKVITLCMQLKKQCMYIDLCTYIYLIRDLTGAGI